ncbi:MAG TPA: TonB-dependent receptor [Opitutaceae bacterium]|nr:TonB-dependent receptor [Opitutaceae bacterium]
MKTPILAFMIFTSASVAIAQVASPPASNGSATASGAPVQLDKFVVTDQLDKARESIVPSLGATSFQIDAPQISTMPLGENGAFNQVLLRAPGVAQDSEGSGAIHVRGEHANLQYRINDVLLPEGLSGFGLEIDPRFVDTMNLVTGSLPAQYGFRTAGIVDIHTKNGAVEPTGEVSLFGGSFDTWRPSFETAGSQDSLTYFVDGSYDHNDLGVESPTDSKNAIHDTTKQTKAFVYLSNIIDASSRLSFMGSLSNSDYQLPNTPALDPGTAPNGQQWLPGSFDSTLLDETQKEKNYYGVLAYQKSAGDLNYQIAGFGRSSSVHFRPDVTGDLFFDGVASNVSRTISSGGAELDSSYAAGTTHTVRAGAMFLRENLDSKTNTYVFPVDGDGNPTGPAFPIADNGKQHATFAGVYLQDEWKPVQRLTVNYGARFDRFSSTFDTESQLSPRLNVIWQPTEDTTLHGGYARYFTPPPLEFVPATSVSKFDGTSNASEVSVDDPVRAEKADYFDVGISQKVAPGLQVGLDGYYKTASQQLDDGLFGASLIQSAFNYSKGRIYGLEFTGSYTNGGFSSYLNLAHSTAEGKDWVSSQFLFGQDDLDYVHNHWIHLDHDQKLSGSFGAAYAWKDAHGGTKVFIDVIHGSGLRTDATDSAGNTIPNGGTVPSYTTVNLGAERSFKVSDKQAVKLRFDVVNLADKKYELRDGAGVGVNAAQFGMRRGFFGTLSWAF